MQRRHPTTTRWWLSIGLSALSLGAAPSALAAPIRTLLLGDSITAGMVSEPVGPPFATLVAEALAGTHDVVNVAQGGLSAYYWAPGTPCPDICDASGTVFDELATPALPAQVATVLLGTNDSVGFFLPESTPVDDWEGYMREILDGLFAGGVHTVILMAAPDANVSETAVSLLHGYRDRVNTICADTAGVVCGPDLIDLLDDVSDFAPGDVHPNASGHAKIADALTQAILAVPEPDTVLLVGLGLAAGLVVPPRERRRSRARAREAYRRPSRTP